MLSAVEAQKQTDQWTKDGGQYIPHPSTWLNQGRWEDETEIEVEKRRETGYEIGERLVGPGFGELTDEQLRACFPEESEVSNG
jgi:hypothetical protein